jgi:RTX calcium-binding nonapeptide repeat (4 copies)
VPGGVNCAVAALSLRATSSIPPGSYHRDTALAEVLVGRAGHDRLSGRAGGDCLRGGAGDDRLRGGPAGDRLRGGAGNEYAPLARLDGPRARVRGR